jgi:hypothetical protein
MGVKRNSQNVGHHLWMFPNLNFEHKVKNKQKSLSPPEISGIRH